MRLKLAEETKAKVVKILYDKDKMNLRNALLLFADKQHYEKYYKKQEENSDIPFICIGSCEGLLARSHFMVSAILSILECSEWVNRSRLGNGHKIKRFLRSFKNTLLRDEPLFSTKGSETNSKHINRSYRELKATERLLKNFKRHKTLHPCKVYWFLVGKEKINLRKASRFHSQQGMMRLIINYLYSHFEKDAQKWNINYTTALEYYTSIGKEFEDKEVLPIGIDYELNEVFDLLNIFFKEFIKYAKAKDKEDRIKNFGNLTDLSIQMLRISNDYRNAKVKENLNKFALMMNNHLLSYYKELPRSDKATFFYRRWHSKCQIVDRFQNLSFIPLENNEKTISSHMNCGIFVDSDFHL